MRQIRSEVKLNLTNLEQRNLKQGNARGIKRHFTDTNVIHSGQVRSVQSSPVSEQDENEEPSSIRKKYERVYCGKEFHRSDNLAEHIRSHTGEQPYNCLRCQKAFTTKSNLNRHMRNC